MASQNKNLRCHLLLNATICLLIALDMNIPLREGNLDAVGIERVVDALQHVADNVGLFRSLGPYKDFEVYA